MTNREKYKQAFSAIHISDELNLEVNKMTTKSKKLKLNRLVASIAVCVLVVGSATAAYATNFCGVQRAIQLWIRGEETDVTIQFDGNGNYTMDYVDEEGNTKNRGGGGIAIGNDGTERPLTEKELLDELMAPDIEYEEDGSVWVYWFDQTVDITDKFEDGICYIKLVNGEETLYMTVKYKDGFMTSPNSYQRP